MFGYNPTYTSPAGYQMQANQNRIDELRQYGNYNPYNTQPVQAQPQAQYIKGRPVSSYEEAKASMIDLDGSLFVFPDIANKRIYTKQILLDGTADFKVYNLVQENTPVKTEQNNTSDEYVLRKDFEDTITILTNEIKKLKDGVWNEPEQNSGNVKSSNAKQSNV